LVKGVGLEPANYFLQTFDSMEVNGIKVKAKAMVIDKPRLIADLLKGAAAIRLPLNRNEFDRIIDATGIARAILPPINRDVIDSCIQYRVFSQETFELGIDVSNLGYAWRFPLSHNEFHIGAGSFGVSPKWMLEQLGWLKNTSSICACTEKIRLTAPYASLPFVDMPDDGRCSIWGAGEAIGCVAPLVGEGIIPGLKSAHLLLANWDDPEAYRRAILKEFSWMEEERKLLDKAAQGKRLGLYDAKILSNSTRRFRINLDYSKGLFLLKSLVKVG
jgi:flavin-dependent dehydrogenase